MITSTTLKILLNPFKVIYLWNEIQIQLIKHNKIVSKPQKFVIFSTEQTQTANQRLRLQHQRRFESASQ